MHGPDRHGVGPGWRRRSGDLSRTDHPGSADCCIGLLILTLTEWRRTWTGATQAKQRLIESTINLFATGPCCVCVCQSAVPNEPWFYTTCSCAANEPWSWRSCSTAYKGQCCAVLQPATGHQEQSGSAGKGCWHWRIWPPLQQGARWQIGLGGGPDPHHAASPREEHEPVAHQPARIPVRLLFRSFGFHGGWLVSAR